MLNRALTEGYDARIIPHLKHKVDVLYVLVAVVLGQLVHLVREWALGDSDIPPVSPSPIRS